MVPSGSGDGYGSGGGEAKTFHSILEYFPYIHRKSIKKNVHSPLYIGPQYEIRNCHRPSGPKAEIQHDQRGRGMPTLTREKEAVTIREGISRCCSFTKKEIMILKKCLQMKYHGACY